MMKILLGPSSERIAYFAQDDRLVFFKEARNAYVAKNLLLRGIELPLNLRPKFGCKCVDYPPENCSHDLVKKFKDAFDQYYFPIVLEPSRFTLVEEPICR